MEFNIKIRRIHFEFASIGDQTLVEALVQSCLPRVNSIGLNEQELTTLYQALGGNLDALNQPIDSSVPDPESVTQAIDYVYKHTQADTRQLSRVHFHCFGYHIIAQTSSSPFHDAIGGAVAGSVKATERACNKTELTSNDLELHLKRVKVNGEVVEFSGEKVFAVWSMNGIDYVLVPVLACAHPVQTVGLGDSISASALAYQI